MAGAPLNRMIRRHFRAIIAGAMVPLAVLSGQPVYGCICADGHYELFCQAGRCPKNAKSAGATAACCGCSCCAQAGPKDGSHACCKAKVDCHARAAGAHDHGCPSSQQVVNTRCCTPVILEASIATVASSVQAVDDLSVAALYLTTQVATVCEPAAQSHGHFQPDFGSPPDDLVVILQRLVI